MTRNPKLEIIPPLPREFDPVTHDVFHEDRVRRDLATFIRTPGVFSQYAERARIRFQKAGERAILEHWINFYQSAERLINAKTAMERRRSEYRQLAREHELKETEKTATLAKLRADSQEHGLRCDKAAYQREHLERYVEGGANVNTSENEQHLNEAHERRQLDARWNLHESLGALQTLVELQHWRRQQRNRILEDRSLTPEEQTEDLQFIDDLYQQKHAELKQDVRIFEEQ